MGLITAKSDWWQMLSPPEVGAQIAPSLSPEVLIEIWHEASEGYNSPLDQWEVASALLDSGEPAKEILVLKNFNGYGAVDQGQKLLDFAKKSRGHAMAIASNARMEWNFRGFSERLLAETFPYKKGQRGRYRWEDHHSDWESLVFAAVANPSFNLSTVAALIRGEGPFGEVPAEARSDVADKTMFSLYRNSKTAKKKQDAIWDSPSAYERDVGKAAQALFSLVRSGDYTGNFTFPVEALLATGVFSILQEDWLDDGVKTEDFQERRNLALGRFVRWWLDHVADEPLDVEDPKSHDALELFSKGNFAVISILCALRQMGPVYRREVLDELRDSSNWIARAAYYGNEISIFADANGDRRAKEKKTKELIKALERDDLAFIRGAFSYEKTGPLDDRLLLPSGLGGSALHLPDGAASKAFVTNLSRLPGSQLEDDTTEVRSSEEVYELENLLVAIQSTEQTARFAPYVIFGFVALFLWLLDGSNPTETTLLVAVFLIAFLFAEVFNLKALNLKAELREIIRSGPTPDSVAFRKAHENLHKQKGRWLFWQRW